MLIDEEFIETLLFQEEDVSLDFKRQQYSFIKASDEEKSELLKDILTFSNAWRRSDAFIVIGVEKDQGKKGVIRGITEHFDDASLQQFVNSKTQRPVTFHYKAVEVQGKHVGVIHLPLQKRPIYLNKDYGKIKKGEVWIRRGSSSAVAEPDEVAQMGLPTAQPAPQVELELFFAKPGRKSLGLHLDFASLVLRAPDKKDIPDYSQKLSRHDPQIGNTNYDYYRELVRYTTTVNLVRPLSFGVANYGELSAIDVRLEIILEDPANNILLLDQYDFPKVPEDTHSFLRPVSIHDRPQHDIWVKRLDQSRWIIQARVGKVQPKDTAWLNSRIYLGAYASCEINFDATLYADNLSIPYRTAMSITVASEIKDASLQDILKIEEERMINDLIKRGLITREQVSESEKKRETAE